VAQSPTQHQDYNGIPPYDSGFLYPGSGIVQRNWYWFLLQIWRALGGSFGQVSQASFLQGTSVYASGSGKFLGKIITSNVVGAPAVPQTLTTSPFVFVATSLGMLAVYGGEVEFSRDAGVTWYPIGLTGGPIFMLDGDQVRITWYTSNAPPVTWFPTATA